MGKRRALLLCVEWPRTQYFTVYGDWLERNGGSSTGIDVRVDREMALTPDELHGYATLLFCHQDPLRQMYPDVYEYAKRVQAWCEERGIRMLNGPDALSATGKAEQLQRLRNAGVPVARAVRLEDWGDALHLDDLPEPFFLRYDLGHDTEGQGFSEPYSTREELRQRPPEDGAWSRRERLAGLSAVEWIDTRSADGLYRKYRAWVIGGRVIRGNLTVSQHWFVHYTVNFYISPHLPEMHKFAAAEPSAAERDLFSRAAAALSLDVAAIDYAFGPDGEIVVWEVNPQPMYPQYWGDREPFRTQFTDLMGELLVGGTRGPGR